jgi:hypothetical protein
MIRAYTLARGWSEDGYLGPEALDDLRIDVNINIDAT